MLPQGCMHDQLRGQKASNACRSPSRSHSKGLGRIPTQAINNDGFSAYTAPRFFCDCVLLPLLWPPFCALFHFVILRPDFFRPT